MNEAADHCPLYIRFTGSEKWASFEYFNANRYPDDLKETAESCGDRFSLLLYYATILEPQLNMDAACFLAQLNQYAVKLQFTDRSWTECIASYHSVVHTASVHGMLFNLKSFLDSLAYLWGRMVAPNCSVHMFSRKNVNGDKIAGGALINWLRKSAPSDCPAAGPLAQHLEDHSRRWITQAVKHRDDLIHYGGIRGLQGLSASVQEHMPRFSPTDLRRPTMPNDEPVTDYCRQLATNVEEFVRDGLAMLDTGKYTG